MGDLSVILDYRVERAVDKVRDKIRNEGRAEGIERSKKEIYERALKLGYSEEARKIVYGNSEIKTD